MNLMTGLGIPQTSLIIDATVILDPTRAHVSSQNDAINITQIIHCGILFAVFMIKIQKLENGKTRTVSLFSTDFKICTPLSELQPSLGDN